MCKNDNVNQQQIFQKQLTVVFNLVREASKSRNGVRASSFIEVLVAIAFLIPLFLTFVDALLIFAAYNWNSEACCCAARSASFGPPDAIAKGQPRKRALASLNSAHYPRELMVIEPDIEVKEKIKPIIDGDVFGGQVEGTVTVATTADVTTPFLLLPILGKKKIFLRSSQTFPYSGSISPSQIDQSRTK